MEGSVNGGVDGKGEAIALFRAGDLEGARRACRRHCAESPEDAEGWLLLGLCQRGLGERQEALLSLRRAAGMDAGSADADAALGRTYMDLFQFGPAVAAFQAGLSKEADHQDCHHGLGEALLKLARFREAEAALREAIALFPDSAHLRAQLAAALEQMHRLDEARVEVEGALALHPGHLQAALLLARIDRRAGNLEAAREGLERILAGESSPQLRAAAGADLGKVLDRMGRYSEAFAAFEAGNRALEATVDRDKVDVDHIFHVIDNRRICFDANTTQGWAAEEPDDGVDSPVLLVGFSRSGTTLVEQVLASHPGAAANDEQPLLARLVGELPSLLGRPLETGWDLCDVAPEALTRVRRRYWELVGEMVGPVGEGQRLLDKLPLNIIDLGYLLRFFPRAPVVVMIRDPRDVCLSCFMQSFHLNQANVNFLDLERTARLYKAVMELWMHYRSFITNPFFELRYEDLVADPEGRARALLEFVGLPWDDRVLRFYEQAGEHEVRTPSYSGVASPIYRQAVGRWRSYRGEMEGVLDTLSQFVEAFGYAEEVS